MQICTIFSTQMGTPWDRLQQIDADVKQCYRLGCNNIFQGLVSTQVYLEAWIPFNDFQSFDFGTTVSPLFF